jgi:hypothetical protein
MIRHIFVDFLNKGHSHFFFNTAFIEKNIADGVMIEFYTYKCNYARYQEYFKNNKGVIIKGYFLDYLFISNNLNYMLNGLCFLFINKKNPKSIVILSTDYTFLPSFLYLFPTNNVFLVLHQVRFALSKSLLKINLWKIILKNDSFKFILLSRAQLDFLISKNFSVKSCLVFFHPFQNIKS